jgi:hypothetical protein
MGLRSLSARPGLLVDPQARLTGDQESLAGQAGSGFPWGRERVVEALKLNNNPPQRQWRQTSIADYAGLLLFDPTDASVVGDPGLWIPRLLKATRTRDTRRL